MCSKESSVGLLVEAIARLTDRLAYSKCGRGSGGFSSTWGREHNPLDVGLRSRSERGKGGTMKIVRRLAPAIAAIVALLLAGAADFRIG